MKFFAAMILSLTLVCMFTGNSAWAKKKPHPQHSKTTHSKKAKKKTHRASSAG